ncbi:hypothetical protein MMC30_003526 [Trapelia coarctata]|nr:hypothetical protein [Trapelia coarctata]
MSDRNSDDGRNESEVSQLLPPQMSTPPGKQPSLLLLLYAITICLYLAEYIALAPRTEIYESVICRNRHPDITINGAFTGSATWYENKCKGREVQQELALLQGTERLLGALPSTSLSACLSLLA